MSILLSILFLFSAPQDTLPPAADTLSVPADTVAARDINLEEKPEEEFREVAIWRYRPRPAHTVAETDSTLRWMYMLNLTDRFARQPGAFTYRTGTIGRLDGVDLYTFENRHFTATMNHMQIDDPLTGAINWNRVPIHKIVSLEEHDTGARHQTDIRLRDHYLTQPRTYLNFDEGAFDYRSLEFSATHNINEKTNLDLTFWDRRDGIGFNRTNIDGTQVVLMGYRQLTDRWLLKTGYINNSTNQDQSFGFVVDDPQFFAFNVFAAQPNESFAESKERSTDLYVQLHHREATDRDVGTVFGLHYQTDERTLSYSADTVGTDFRRIEFFTRFQPSSERIKTSVDVRAFALENRNREQLTTNAWLGLSGNASIETSLGRALRISVNGGGTIRDDDRQSMFGGTELTFFPERRVSLSLFGSAESRAPDLQALYWQSAEFSGSSALPDEVSVGGGAELRTRLSGVFTLGARGDLRRFEDATFVNASGTFEAIDPYTRLSGTGWLELDGRLFEGGLSATYHRIETSTSLNPINQSIGTTGDRLWIRGSLFWKNFVFDRAAFVKAGVRATMSPNQYRPAGFITPLNRWQQGEEELFNPSFSRLDFDMSARIRWFMLLIRYENLLEDLTQTGYFETVGFPMPQRRFILGLRILFTN
ncbi:MAG: hypothetical protein ACNA78_09945 [Balneolaceae bacterium]